MSRTGKPRETETDEWLSGVGGRENGEGLLLGRGFLFGVTKCSGNHIVQNPVNIPKTTKSYTLKW